MSVIPHSALRIPHLRWLIAVASVTVAVLYLWGLGGFGLLDPDEGMNAEIAREMLVGKDAWVPRFDGIPYIEKPPLMYWLTAATFAILGPSEFAARLWKVLPALGTIALTYALGARLFSPGVGARSAVVLATCLGLFVFSRITEMDPLFLFGLTLSAYGIVRLGLRSQSEDAEAGCGPGGLWLWLGAGIAVMSKGMLGVFLPLALLVLWRLIRQDRDVFRRAWSGTGALVAAGLVIPWHLVAGWRVPGFFQFYVMDNQVLRFLGARAYVEDGRSITTLSFLAVTTVALFPWTPYLAGALWGVVQETWNPGGANQGGAALTDWRWRFLAAWFLLVMGLFAVSSFKLEYYGLPAFPAAALLVGALSARAGERGQEGEASARRADPAPPHARAVALLGGWSWVALIGGLVFVVAVAWAWEAGEVTPRNIIHALSYWGTNYRVLLEQQLPLPPISTRFFGGVLLGGGLLWVVGYGAALHGLRVGRVTSGTAAVAAVGAGLVMLAGGILQEVGPHHSLKPLAERLEGILRPDDLLVHERGLEKGGGLLFYTGRKVLVLNGVRGDLEFGSRLPGYERTFIDTAAFRNLWASGSRVFLVTNLPWARSAISRTSDPTPILVASTGTRWLYSNQLP